jgi:hypothetical protein
MKTMKNKKQQPRTRKQTMGSKPAATPKTPKSDKVAAAQKRTIKLAVIEAIAANATVTNAEMIAAVKTEFPKSAFKDSHAAWYRSQARKGLLTGSPITIPAMGRNQSKTAN